jgi:small subunit ribosomal protein S3
MESGALGAEIVLSGKVTGARSRVEKFNRGYIKHNGEPAEEIVDHGVATAVMKLGTIGVQVKIIPPGAELPDDFRIHEGVEVEDYVETDADVEELLPEEGEEPTTGPPPEEGEEPAEEIVEEAAEDGESDEEVIEEPEEFEDPDLPGDDVEEELGDLEADVEQELDEDTEEEAEELIEEMDEAAETDEDEAAETDEDEAAETDEDTAAETDEDTAAETDEDTEGDAE